MRPSATSDRYANDSAMPSAIQRTPTMHALPPIAYCQRCTCSWDASSVRSTSAVQVSGAAAGGELQARFDVTISKLSPSVTQQYRCVPSPTETRTVEARCRDPPARRSR